jgi:hypothetical protein
MKHAKHVLLANAFIDGPYHRTGFTLTSWGGNSVRRGYHIQTACAPSGNSSITIYLSPHEYYLYCHVPQLSASVVDLASAALEALDLRNHVATHPRLGVVDHISVHPLPFARGSDNRHDTAASRSPVAIHTASPDAGHVAAAVDVVRSVASRLASEPWDVPCYFYGAAHPQNRKLADIRRELGATGWCGPWAAGIDCCGCHIRPTPHMRLWYLRYCQVPSLGCHTADGAVGLFV